MTTLVARQRLMSVKALVRVFKAWMENNMRKAIVTWRNNGICDSLIVVDSQRIEVTAVYILRKT